MGADQQEASQTDLDHVVEQQAFTMAKNGRAWPDVILDSRKESLRQPLTRGRVQRVNDALVITKPDVKDVCPAQSENRRIGLAAFAGTFGTSIAIHGFTVLQGVIVARLLGPLGRGEYATVILWPSVFAAIGILGTNIALARAAAKIHRPDPVFRTAVVLAGATSIISATLCYCCIPYLLPDAEAHLLRLARLFVPFIILNHLGLNLQAVDQGAGNFKRFNLTRMLLYPVYVTFLVVMWVWDVRQVAWAAAGLLVANAAVVAVRVILALRDMPLRGPLYSPRETLRESVRFGLVGASQPLYLHADKAILLWLLGAENLGLYVVALSASAAIGSITNSAGMVSFTMAAQAGPGDGFERIARMFRISALLWIVFGIALALAMRLLLPLVYGQEFAAAVNPARLLIVGSAFGGLANLVDQTLRGQGRAFVGFEGRIVGLAAMVAAGIALSHWFGLPGMCLAYAVGQGICLAFFLWRILAHYAQPINAIRTLAMRWADVPYLCSRAGGMLRKVVAG